MLMLYSGKSKCESSPRKLWLGHQLIVVIDDPEQLQKVLSSKYCLDKPDLYKGIKMEQGLRLLDIKTEC